MPKEILINAEPQERRVAIVADGKLDEFYIERPQDKTIVGNIYKGRIDAVLPSIGGAFVDIGLPKKGFLYLSEIEYSFDVLESDNPPAAEQQQPQQHNKRRGGRHNKHRSAKSASTLLGSIKKGQEILVQVVKESFGNKGPRLSCHIGVAGRFLVLMPQEPLIGVSRRLVDVAERKRLRQVLSEIKDKEKVGFIVRTAAAGKAQQELLKDANFLIRHWRKMEQAIASTPAPALVHEEYDLIFRTIRDSFNDEVSKIIVDSRNEFFRLQRFMRTFMSSPGRKIEFYRGIDLFADKDVERQVNKMFEPTVYLNSKAYIIIEPTEGLVVIDVNSGGFKNKNLNQEDTAFKVNCEAALEVAHQLKLRDLGGIIVIDFIDMMKEHHRREVLKTLENALSNGGAKYDLLGISKFGLVEMTRERVHNTVQTLSYQICPYCQGRGRVKSAVTVAIRAFKDMKKRLKEIPAAEVNITVNPAVIDEMMKSKNTLAFIERKFRTRINLISNPAAHVEEIKFS